MSANIRELDQNRETIARLLSKFKRARNEKCYFPCKHCNISKTRRIKNKIAKRHCRENGHTKGGLIIINC